MLAEHPEALVLAGGTDLMVEINDGHRRPDDVVIAVNRVPELRSWRHDPAAATLTIGAAITYTELLADPLAAVLAGAGRGVAYGRFPADPQRRHARRQPRHVLARRRRASGARRARCHGHAGVGRRRSHRARSGVHGRREAHGDRAGGVDRRDHRADRSRLAGLRQGRGAQRHGHRRRQRLSRGRRVRAADRARPRVGRPDDHPVRRGRGRARRRARLGDDDGRRRRSRRVRAAGRRRRPPDHRSPLERRVPAPRGRGAGDAPRPASRCRGRRSTVAA